MMFFNEMLIYDSFSPFYLPRFPSWLSQPKKPTTTLWRFQSYHQTTVSTTAKPAPSVTWYFDDSLIDDSYFSEQRGLSRNELQLSHLNRTHLNSQLTCRSQNSNLTKATQTTLSIDFIRK